MRSMTVHNMYGKISKFNIDIEFVCYNHPPPYPSCFPLRWYSVCAGNRWIAFGNSCEVKLPVENMRWDCVQCGAVVSHALIKLLADFVPTWRVTFPSQPAAFSRFKPTFHSGISNIHFLSWDFWSEKKKYDSTNECKASDLQLK